MTYLEALILAFIEGLTEFLPISSTGHLILASAYMGIENDGFVKSFNIIIQFGAIASVLVLYWRRFLPDLAFYKKIIISFLPAAIVGLLIKNKIDALLGSVTVVAIALIVGGIVLICSDYWFKATNTKGRKIHQLTWQQCLLIGFIQCFAFIPGISRAAATILGGLSLGLDRKEATEFSFFLAVPTLAGAAFIKGLKEVKTLDGSHAGILIFGTFFSFIFAMIAIRIFLHLISRFGFKHFGIYRIVLGFIVLSLIIGGAI